jgi:hypothetical protein
MQAKGKARCLIDFITPPGLGAGSPVAIKPMSKTFSSGADATVVSEWLG